MKIGERVSAHDLIAFIQADPAQVNSTQTQPILAALSGVHPDRLFEIRWADFASLRSIYRVRAGAGRTNGVLGAAELVQSLESADDSSSLASVAITTVEQSMMLWVDVTTDRLFGFVIAPTHA